MATPYKDTIKVAIRVRPLIKRENDFHQNLNWKVNKNTISQVSNGKLLANSSYIFDRIFDTNNTTQDVYDEFGRPIALSAMDGFNGTIFAYGQTSSGKTYTMMGDQSSEGVIPKAVGEIYDYIEKHPSREFLIRVSYMEIYNEDIRDLLNPMKTNLKIHENTQRQVYVGELTEEVVSCAEDVFKHMLRGEKNRHFGETNMNDRSSRSHTIFRVVIESREMMDESKDRDTIDGAVRVAHLNLVDLAGSERASQTGAVGQRLKEGGHINKSLLALGSVIAKLSDGESFVPFRDSKLTRILQSSLGGNAKTSMICTITPAAVEETISTLKFASRAKTVKNCPEVNEVLDDGTLLKRYRKEISELKKQLTAMSQQSTSLHLQELQVEKEKMAELLEQHKKQQCEQEDRIKKLCNMICSSTRENEPRVSVKARIAKRRETWCPGPILSKNPLASAAAFAEQVHIAPASPESDEDGFDGISKDSFLSMLNAEEKKKCPTRKERKVCFTSPQIVRYLSPIRDEEEKISQEMQTEPDERLTELQQEVKRLRKDLNEAISERDLFNRLLEESNSLIEKMSVNGGPSAYAQSSEATLKYVSEIRKEKSDLEEQVSSLQNQCRDLEAIKVRNAELEDKAQSLENELTLTSEYLTELQSEYDGVQAKNQTLSDRVEELESTGTLNASVNAEMESLKTALEERSREKEQLMMDLDAWIQKSTALDEEIQRLNVELASKVENSQHQENACNVGEDLSFKTRELEIEIRRLDEELRKSVSEKENEVNELVIKSRYVEENFELFRREKENELSELAVKHRDLEENFALFKEKREEEMSELVLKNRDIEENFALFRKEKEKEISELALENRDREENFELFKLEKDKEINELALKNRDIEENFALFRMEKEKELNDLNLKFELFKEKKQLEVNELQVRNCEFENKLELLKRENENESLKYEENMELFRREKGNEIDELKRDIKIEDKCELVKQEKEIKERDQRNSEIGQEKENEVTALCGVKEQFDKATNTEKDGRRSFGADGAMEVDLRAKMSNLEVELERKTSQYEELEKLLDRVKKERDEIKNDLSETITDTAELQQELLSMQQKVKRYKEHIHEMEEERQELETCATSHQKQVEDLTKQLNLAREEFELASNNTEQIKQHEQNECDARESERLASLLEEEKTRVQEISEESDKFRSKAEKLQERVATLEKETSTQQKEACELQENIRALENDVSEFHQQRSDSEKLFKEEKEKYNALAKEFEKLKGKIDETSQIQGDLCYQLELQKSKKEIEELTRDLVDEKKTHEALRKDYTSLSEELQQLKNSLVQDRNRGMNQQRVIDKMKEERRETICSQAAQRQEMEKELQEANKRVSDLESQCSYLRSERDLMEHRLEVANKKAEETKQEMRDMENLYSVHDTRAVTQIDEQKATQKMRQLEFNMDLTKQKLEKAEKRLKELESENRQLLGADIRNGSLTEEREELKNQLQQAKNVLHEKSKKLNELSIEVTQLKAHVEKLADEKKKNRSTIEKKDAKIDELEEKLWETQELLRAEQEDTKNQKAQSSMLDELNSTIRVKHEELEHMTFLVDEREIEIAEMRSSLKENELKHGELQETILQSEQRGHELESKLTDANSKLLQMTTKLNEAEQKIAELEVTVQRSYADKATNDGQMEELSCKVEKLDNDLGDREHKVLEMEGELELMNVRLEEHRSMKESLIEVLNVYSEALDNDGTANEAKTSDLEELQRRQKLHIERLSQIKETALKVEDFSQQLHASNEEKRNLEGKLAELESSVEGEKALLEEQIEETRKSMLNEKRLVIELEAKVNFEVKRREAVETELRRVLVEREGEKSSNIEGELRKELHIEKAAKEQLNKQNEILLREKEEFECTINDLKETAEQKNSEVFRLQLEVSRMKDHVEATVDRENVSHALSCELEALTEKYQLAEKEFEERLELYVRETDRLKAITDEMQEKQEKYERNINELKTTVELKESEIRDIENEHRKELHNERATNRQLDNRIEDLVREREEFKCKVNELYACAKNDSKLSRLISELSRMKEEGLDAMSRKDVSLVSDSELKALREKCQLAEKDSKERLELFFKETERLKGIIDEMQEEQEEFERKINELKQSTEQKDSKILLLESEMSRMKENAKTASNKMDVSLVSNKELDDLKEQCQLAEKESKESLELYFRETDRLKAIIDEMQEEQEEYIRQLDELKETAGQKESVIAKLKLEISEVMKQGKVKETVDPAPNVDEEDLRKVKGELAGAQLRVSQLEYDLFKLRELHDQETKRLAKEVDCSNEKARNLKLEIRKLREFGSEDTICMLRGQAHPSKQAKRGSDGDDEAGVVSNVAVYSLKAKLGKLEGDAEKLNEKVHQLEKEKSTLALLNTETSNKVAQLTSDNNLLKAQKKKLFEELQRYKKLQENSLPRVQDVADAPDRSLRNSSVLGVSTTENVCIQPAKQTKSVADYKANTKQTGKTDNWLDGASIFEEDPNQCINQ